jgi:hypothetical protein
MGSAGGGRGGGGGGESLDVYDALDGREEYELFEFSDGPAACRVSDVHEVPEPRGASETSATLVVCDT